MKIELTLKLDLPSGQIDTMSDEEISQLLFDSIANKLVIAHLQSAQSFARMEDTRAMEICNLWTDAISTATWDWKIGE